MNHDKIIQSLKNGLISAEAAMKYLRLHQEVQKAEYLKSFDEYEIATADHDLGDDLVFIPEYDHEEDPEEFTKLIDIAKELTTLVKNVVGMWTGVYKTQFRSLTPDVLGSLGETCNKIQSLAAERDLMLASCIDMYFSSDELDEYARVYSDAEKAVVYCILQSLALSQGQDIDTPEHKTTLDGFTRLHLLGDFDCDMLQVVQVTPWEMPPCPPLSIPERPSVVIEVMVVGEGTVDAGWDDVFNPITMVKQLPVDEELFVGDKIIVKASKWDSDTSLIKDPEFDGASEPDCPLVTEDELLALDYTFDPEKEQVKLLTKHRSNWFGQNWMVLTNAQILRIGNGESVEKVTSKEDQQDWHEKLLQIQKYTDRISKEYNTYYSYNTDYKKQITLQQQMPYLHAL